MILLAAKAQRTEASIKSTGTTYLYVTLSQMTMTQFASPTLNAIGMKSCSKITMRFSKAFSEKITIVMNKLIYCTLMGFWGFG